MQRERLFELHRQLCDEGYTLMQKKNADYGSQSDPFASFRMFGELGILVRLGDKLSRLKSFTEKGFMAVVTESVKDTIIDIINYAVLLYAFLEEQGKVGVVQAEPEGFSFENHH